MTIGIQVCTECFKHHYPAVLLCARCGNGDLRVAHVKSGRVVARTDVSYQIGDDSDQAVWLASVEIDEYTHVLARLQHGALHDDVVELELLGRALVAKPLRPGE